MDALRNLHLQLGVLFNPMPLSVRMRKCRRVGAFAFRLKFLQPAFPVLNLFFLDFQIFFLILHKLTQIHDHLLEGFSEIKEAHWDLRRKLLLVPDLVDDCQGLFPLIGIRIFQQKFDVAFLAVVCIFRSFVQEVCEKRINESFDITA